MTPTDILALIPPLALIAGMVWVASRLDRCGSVPDEMADAHGDVPAMPKE